MPFAEIPFLCKTNKQTETTTFSNAGLSQMEALHGNSNSGTQRGCPISLMRKLRGQDVADLAASKGEERKTDCVTPDLHSTHLSTYPVATAGRCHPTPRLQASQAASARRTAWTYGKAPSSPSAAGRAGAGASEAREARGAEGSA